MHKYLLILLCCLLTAACQVVRPQNAASPSRQEGTADSVPYQAVPTRYWALVHTSIDIGFQMLTRTATGTARLTLHPFWYPQDSVILDAKGMKIYAVSIQNQPTAEYGYNGSKLTVRLPKSYHREDTLQLTVKYLSQPYAFEHQGDAAITEARGLYFINTDGFEPYQSVQVWTQGETEANSNWFPTFDHPVFRSTFDIRMRVPDSLQTLSNGRLVRSEMLGEGVRMDVWEQALPIPPYLVMMAVGKFAVAEDNWNGKSIRYYVPENYGSFARRIFNHTPEMIAFFSEKLKVDFPWAKYSQLIGYDYVSGAMENVSASLFGAFNLKDDRQLADDNNDYIVAHELFHQWFGDYVTCESWGQLTLNESFADFSEKLWAAYKYGSDQAAIQRRNSLNRFLKQAAHSDPPLVRYHYHHPGEMFDRVSYSKGGWILWYLKALVGEDAFFEALHRYLTENALQSAEADQLRICLEKVTGEDWNWFFDQWYYRGGHPELSLQYDFNDEQRVLTVITRQEQPGDPYRLPLFAGIIRGDRWETVNWLVAHRVDTFQFDYDGAERPVFVPDVGYLLPGEISDKKSLNAWKQQFHAGAGLRSSHAVVGLRDSSTLMVRWRALDGVFSYRKSDREAVLEMIEEALSDQSYIIRKAALDMLSVINPRNLDYWKPQLIRLATKDPNNQVRAAAFSYLGFVDADEYASSFDFACQDRSYLVATAALQALNRVSHTRALSKIESLKDTNSYSALWQTAAGLILAEDAQPDDYLFYEERLWHFFEGDRTKFMTAFAAYLNAVKDDAVYHRGLRLIERMAVKEGNGSRFQIQMFANVYEMYRYAKKKEKVTENADAVAGFGRRKLAALEVWNRYKATLHTVDEQKKAAAVEADNHE